jgi:two-component system, NtrC family, sensor kinase
MLALILVALGITGIYVVARFVLQPHPGESKDDSPGWQQKAEQYERELNELMQQQTATSEILRVISQSQSVVQPVFETIAANALKLCRSTNAAVFTFDGELIHIGAVVSISQEGLDAARRAFPIAPDAGNATARAILTREIAYVEDVFEDPEYRMRDLAQAVGFRSVLCVPMLLEGNPIGVVNVTGAEPAMFTDRQIAMLKTFAHQAVIAIQNARLFNELQTRNRDLSESLEQQTATSEILRVISQSQRDVQPVFETIATSARELCSAKGAAVFTFDGELLHRAAADDSTGQTLPEPFRDVFPRHASRDNSAGRAILTRAVCYISDVRQDPEHRLQGFAEALGYRSTVSVPMLKAGAAIGVISVIGAEPAMFTERQIAMLQTFADQAVIAIENVRLFTELQEQLEQQTATSEILRVISQSQRDVQPVFETIAANAQELCRATNAEVYTFDGELIKIAAAAGFGPEGLEAIRRTFPMPPSRSGATARAVLTRALVYIPDIHEDVEYRLQNLTQMLGVRSVLSVPMLRDGNPIGAISMTGSEPAMFSERQIAMLQTFADQAVIAIENTRLFNELQARTAELGRSVEQLRSLAEVGEAVNSTLDLERVLTTIVTRAVQLSLADGGVVFEFDEATGTFRARATHGFPPEYVEILLATPLRIGEGATGRAAAERAPVHIPDVRVEGAYTGPLQQAAMRLGTRAVLAVPLLRESRVFGSLVVNRNRPGAFAPEVVDLLQTFAAQSTLAIQNARLFREIEQKSRELQTASQHKSQFLANMSHELRTPLNAILGYTELIVDQIYGEVPEKINEVLDRVQKSGRHLLGLINDVLDLSKIEAGQLALELSNYAFNDVVQAVVSAVGSLAAEKRLRLTTDVAPGLPAGQGDIRRITQVLLNLVGNAIKFTDKGEVAVRVSVSDGMFLVAVADTGPGIRQEDQEKIFEEFQQSDTAVTKSKSGTGLGLAIAKRIVGLHGGRIWVESVIGKGSTFFLILPIRAERKEVAVIAT